MKVLFSGRDGWLRGMPGLQWFSVIVGILSALVASSIWVIYCGDDTAPLVLAVAGFGVLNGEGLAAIWRAAANGEGSPEADPEMALLTHLKRMLQLGLTVLDAKSVRMTLWDQSTGERLDWNLLRGQRSSDLVTTRPGPCFRPGGPEFCSAIYVRTKDGIKCLGLNQNGGAIESSKLLKHLNTLWTRPFKTLLLGRLELGSRWQGIVGYVDAPVTSCREEDLVTLHELVSTAGSGWAALEAACDSARVRERRRVACDLHDGVTQSLIATELQIALLERENALAGKENDEVLEKVLETLRWESRNLRVQIEELRKGESSGSLKVAIGRLLHEFEFETGIATEFFCEMVRDEVPRRVAFEMIQLLREALANVRKHSGASRVGVCLYAGDDLHLHVQDDGCGLRFSGTYDLATLRTMRERPRTICERVEANGGNLILESNAGSGLWLQIWLPLPPARGTEGVAPGEMGRTSSGSRRLPDRKPPQQAKSIRYMQRTPR